MVDIEQFDSNLQDLIIAWSCTTIEDGSPCPPPPRHPLQSPTPLAISPPHPVDRQLAQKASETLRAKGVEEIFFRFH